MRVVVVGASSGLGRSIALGLAERGSQVAFLARRIERLTEAAKQAGNGALAVRCDVTDPDSCAAAIDEVVAGMGGIDALVYSTGVAPLGRIEDTTPEVWRWTFDTNVVGAASITSAALPHLRTAAGTAVYLSSISASVTPPWPGLAAYAVTKAALDKLVEAWRAEHPAVGFTRLIVGDCAGGDGESMTEFPNQWDTEAATEFGTRWFTQGLITGTLLPVEELVRAVDGLIHNSAETIVPSLIVTPRPPVAG